MAGRQTVRADSGGEEKGEVGVPHISKGYKPNREVLDMVADRLPVEIDVEAEQAKMWEERTK